MMPYILRKTDDVMVRLDVFYTELMRIKFGIGLGEDGKPLRPNDSQEKLTREVFGERVISAATNEWFYAEGFLAAERFPHEWEAMPIHSRAKWMAAKRIESMEQGIRRYREVIERQNRETLSKLQSKRPPVRSRRH